MIAKWLKSLRAGMKFSVRDFLVTLTILLGAVGISFLLGVFDENRYYALVIFVLAVFLIARTTEGYFYGMAASLLSMLLVNFLFTYPFFAFNFTITGYPITFLSMLMVSMTTSTLTYQAKRSTEIRLEAEREKTRSNLLRAVSHDLRTPLTGILGASSAILENDDTINQQERLKLLQGICDDAQWLIRMVENLLTITRMDEQSGAQLVKTPEAAEEILEAAVAKFRRQQPDWQVSVQVPEEFLMIPMDAMLMEQVLMNLMENVVHHGDGADRIWISLKREGNNGVITVQDNGCGVDPARMPDIFAGHMTANYGRDGDRKRNMGIGLSVCRTIVQAHGGTMTAENLPEGGAAFRVSLPMEEDQNE